MICERILRSIVCSAVILGLLVATAFGLLTCAVVMSSCSGCTDPNIHLPRDQCFQYTLEDGTTVVVWMSEVPTAAEGLPVVKDHGLPFPIDPEEFE